MYDALTGLATSGDKLVSALSVLDTESIANQTSIHKVIGTPKQVMKARALLTRAHTQLSQFAWAINAAWVTHVEQLGNNYEAFHT